MKKKLYDNIDGTFRPKHEVYIRNGKNVVVNFNKFFNTDIEGLNLFIIDKPAYNKEAKLNNICACANVFFESYDEDKEFLTALCTIKAEIDRKNSNYMFNQFSSSIASQLLSDSILAKATEMAKDYYDIDLSPKDDVKDIDMNGLQFTNEHGITIMTMSVLIRLLIPVVCHWWNKFNVRYNQYLVANGEEEIKLKEYLYLIYQLIFTFLDGGKYIFDKLTITASKKIEQTVNAEKTMWKHARHRGNTPAHQLEKLVQVTVVDLLSKAEFSKNIIFLIHTALEKSLSTELITKNKYEYNDISVVAKSDDLSGLEKMESSRATVSDLEVVISKESIPRTIKRIQKMYDIDISDNEVNYYRDHITKYPFENIVKTFFASAFSSNTDLRGMTPINYIHLMIIFKRILSASGYVYIQHILTGNISNEIKRRRIASKQLAKIAETNAFKNLLSSYSNVFGDSLDNPIIKTLAKLINTPIEYVDYDNQKMTGKIINVDISVVADEYVRLMKNY